MTLAFGHPPRAGHELFRGRKTVHRYHNGAAPSHHASAICNYAPSRGGSAAEVFRARSLKMPTITLKTLSIHLRTNLLASGRFITALPRSVLWLYAQPLSLKILPVELPTRSWPVAIVALKNHTLSPVVTRFMDCIRDL
jgi:DNA-binding transcriptional LysR family regulator